MSDEWEEEKTTGGADPSLHTSCLAAFKLLPHFSSPLPLKAISHFLTRRFVSFVMDMLPLSFVTSFFEDQMAQFESTSFRHTKSKSHPCVQCKESDDFFWQTMSPIQANCRLESPTLSNVTARQMQESWWIHHQRDASFTFREVEHQFHRVRKLIVQVSHPASAGDRRFHLWQMLTKHIIGVIYEAQIMRLRNSGDDKISFSVGCLMSCLT